jgi:biopolymer transport protein ExbB/TolQ
MDQLLAINSTHSILWLAMQGIEVTQLESGPHGCLTCLCMDILLFGMLVVVILAFRTWVLGWSFSYADRVFIRSIRPTWKEKSIIDLLQLSSNHVESGMARVMKASIEYCRIVQGSQQSAMIPIGIGNHLGTEEWVCGVREVSRRGRQAIDKLLLRQRRSVKCLRTIGLTALMIGMFNTTIYLIDVLHPLTEGEYIRFDEIRGSIADAMVPAAWGLAVGSLSWCCYLYLRRRTEKYSSMLGDFLEELLSHLARSKSLGS